MDSIVVQGDPNSPRKVAMRGNIRLRNGGWGRDGFKLRDGVVPGHGHVSGGRVDEMRGLFVWGICGREASCELSAVRSDSGETAVAYRREPD